MHIYVICEHAHSELSTLIGSLRTDVNAMSKQNSHSLFTQSWPWKSLNQFSLEILLDSTCEHLFQGLSIRISCHRYSTWGIFVIWGWWRQKYFREDSINISTFHTTGEFYKTICRNDHNFLNFTLDRHKGQWGLDQPYCVYRIFHITKRTGLSNTVSITASISVLKP